MLTPTKYFDKAYAIFQENGDPAVSEKQMKYMRNQFEYFGLKAPVWTGLAKVIFKEEGIFQDKALIDFVELCMDDEHREMNYLGIEMAQRAQKKEGKDFIQLIEIMLLANSWWDTVDWLASTLAGKYFKTFPEQIKPITDKWMASENMWLQRSCIIFQLKYKDQVDEDLLFGFIRQIADSKEFFLQKAAGWALRQHSRVNPDRIISFIKNEKLAPLTKREGLRILKKKGII